MRSVADGGGAPGASHSPDVPGVRGVLDVRGGPAIPARLEALARTQAPLRRALARGSRPSATSPTRAASSASASGRSGVAAPSCSWLSRRKTGKRRPSRAAGSAVGRTANSFQPRRCSSARSWARRIETPGRFRSRTREPRAASACQSASVRGGLGLVEPVDVGEHEGPVGQLRGVGPLLVGQDAHPPAQAHPPVLQVQLHRRAPGGSRQVKDHPPLRSTCSRPAPWPRRRRSPSPR